MLPLPPALESLLFRAALGLPPSWQRMLVRRPVVLDGQVLSTETQLMLELQRLYRMPAVEELPLGPDESLDGRRRELVHQAKLAGGRQTVGAIRELVVDGADGDLPARLYTPSSRLGADPVPTLLFLHGGGWVYGDLESHDAACRFLAEHSGVQVLSVDYRLAPEHPLPAPVEDARAAYRWLVKNTDHVNADPERLAVGGDSAGGNLAALVALTAAEEGLPLRAQLLVYPATDFSKRSRSREMFKEGFFLSDRFMVQCEDWYLPAGHDRSDPLASVLLTDPLPDGIAPAHVVTAGFDPLRDEGEAYAALLAEHGVPVTSKRYPSMIHGFFNLVGAGREAREYDREIAGVLAAMVG
jgi:acetyl esterase